MSACKNGGRNKVSYARLDNRLAEDEELDCDLALARAFHPLD